VTRHYAYVGPAAIKNRHSHCSGGTTVCSASDVVVWLASFSQAGKPLSATTATFVVDANGWLRIADRRSEHVACALGEPVLCAGEITFDVIDDELEVSWITNQSTGYCPEPSSWNSVEHALRRAGINSPSGFSRTYEFRRCPNCLSINLIKDNLFRCDVCRSELPHEWNLGAAGEVP